MFLDQADHGGGRQHGDGKVRWGHGGQHLELPTFFDPRSHGLLHETILSLSAR